MKQIKSKTTFKIALIDGVSFFCFFILSYIFGDVSAPIVQLTKIVTLFWQETVFILFPFSILVAWRGKKDAERILVGTSSWYRPALEGSVVAFILAFLFGIIPAVHEAHAAGTIYDGAAYWGFSQWADYILHSASISIIVSLIGAAIALALHALNRILIKVVFKNEQCAT